MDLKTLSDDALIAHTETLVHHERETLAQILRSFREIEVRRLYSKYKCESLYQFVVEKLKYAEDQAGRRIAAMRLLRELPEIEEKIESGDLSLTNLCLAQTLFNKEKPSREEKVQLLKNLENISTRKAAKIIRSVSKNPAALERDLIRELGDDRFKFEFVGDAELKELLEQAKGLLAHAHGALSMNDLLKKLAREAIEHHSPTKRRQSKSPAAPREATQQKPSRAAETLAWKKAAGRCENCGSVYKLEVDHRTPRAAGGSHEPENLRLLCRGCNERAAIEKLGLKKMRPFFDREIRH